MIPSLPDPIRIQPVRPDLPDGKDLGHDLGVAFLHAAVTIPVLTWLLMLAAGNAHTLFPVVPATGYWTTLTLLLGLRIVAGSFRPAAWQWARR